MVDATRPMEADASAPRLPTIAASMYCITMEDSWANIAGKLNLSVRLSLCEKVIGLPSFICDSRRSVSFCMERLCIGGGKDIIFLLTLWQTILESI